MRILEILDAVPDEQPYFENSGQTSTVKIKVFGRLPATVHTLSIRKVFEPDFIVSNDAGASPTSKRRLKVPKKAAAKLRTLCLQNIHNVRFEDGFWLEAAKAKRLTMLELDGVANEQIGEITQLPASLLVLQLQHPLKIAVDLDNLLMPLVDLRVLDVNQRDQREGNNFRHVFHRKKGLPRRDDFPSGNSGFEKYMIEKGICKANGKRIRRRLRSLRHIRKLNVLTELGEYLSFSFLFF